MSQSNGEAGFSAFISHASEDRAVAEQVCQQLERAGFRCWIAPRDVRPGQDYPAEIVRGIEASKCLVLILSRSANDSRFVRAEVERAYSKGKPIFPVRIEEVLPSRALELFVSTKHWIDAWQGELSQHAAQLVQQMAIDPDLEMALPGTLKGRVRTRRFAQYAGVVAVALGVAVLVAYLMQPNLDRLIEDANVHQTQPVSVFFMGGMVKDNEPIEVSFMLNDGWGNNGQHFDAFNSISAFGIYELIEGAPLKPLYNADPKQFSGQFRSTRSYTFTIDGLPKRVVSCVAYRIASLGRREIALQGFNFTKPDSPFASFPATEAAKPQVLQDQSSDDCVRPVADYAKNSMNMTVVRAAGL